MSEKDIKEILQEIKYTTKIIENLDKLYEFDVKIDLNTGKGKIKIKKRKQY